MLCSATLAMGRHFLSPFEKIKNTWLGCWGEVCMPSPCRQIFLYLPDWRLLNSKCVNYWNYQTILTSVFKVHCPLLLHHLIPCTASASDVAPRRKATRRTLRMVMRRRGSRLSREKSSWIPVMLGIRSATIGRKSGMLVLPGTWSFRWKRER